MKWQVTWKDGHTNEVMAIVCHITAKDEVEAEKLAWQDIKEDLIAFRDPYGEVEEEK